MRSVASTAAVLLLIAAATMTISGVSAGACPGGCNPWAGAPCSRKDHLSYVMWNVAGVWNATNGTFTSGGLKFAYSPQVDQLQAFELKNVTNVIANNLLGSYSGSTFVFNNRVNDTYVYMEGGGSVNSPSRPIMYMDSSALIVERGGPGRACGSSDEFAVANFLIFNLTMTDGQFKWAGGGEPPVQVGFDPTCDSSDTCLFGSSKCIGRPGRKNCADCLSKDQLLAYQRLNIWLAYYGTDSDGRAFKSGSDNPLNFEEFAWKPVMNTIVDSVRKS